MIVIGVGRAGNRAYTGPTDAAGCVPSRLTRKGPMRNVRDRRSEMIAQTSAWLTWALSNDVAVPRIPRRSVAAGGFSDLLRLPEARAAVHHWWAMTLDRMDRYRA